MLLVAMPPGVRPQGPTLNECLQGHVLIRDRCRLTQPNFTRWRREDEAPCAPHAEYYYKTEQGGCASVSNGNLLRYDVEKGDPFTAERCSVCAPFTELDECNRVCVDGTDADETENEEMAFEVWYFLKNLFVALYACYGLALCCEDFFVSSLEILIERAAMPADVAGATFMAAGSSSPELFVAAVAIFSPPEDEMCQSGVACVHKDAGIGVGTVVGSTMFNTMCIIGGSAIIQPQGSTTLDWRIVARDGGSYCVSIVVLMWFLIDEVCEEGACMEDLDIDDVKVAARDLKGWCAAFPPRMLTVCRGLCFCFGVGVMGWWRAQGHNSSVRGGVDERHLRPLRRPLLEVLRHHSTLLLQGPDRYGLRASAGRRRPAAPPGHPRRARGGGGGGGAGGGRG